MIGGLHFIFLWEQNVSQWRAEDREGHNAATFPSIIEGGIQKIKEVDPGMFTNQGGDRGHHHASLYAIDFT